MTNRVLGLVHDITIESEATIPDSEQSQYPQPQDPITFPEPEGSELNDAIIALTQALSYPNDPEIRSALLVVDGNILEQQLLQEPRSFVGELIQISDAPAFQNLNPVLMATPLSVGDQGQAHTQYGQREYQRERR